jgi:hypothetical protein
VCGLVVLEAEYVCVVFWSGFFNAVYDGYDGFMMMMFDARCVDMNGIIGSFSLFLLTFVCE